MSNQDKAYDVYVVGSTDKLLGFKWGPSAGGLVYDKNDTAQVVGAIVSGVVRGEWVLKADAPHHTGRRFDGDRIAWDNRPSKRF